MMDPSEARARARGAARPQTASAQYDPSRTTRARARCSPTQQSDRHYKRFQRAPTSIVRARQRLEAERLRCWRLLVRSVPRRASRLTTAASPAPPSPGPSAAISFHQGGSNPSDAAIDSLRVVGCTTGTGPRVRRAGIITPAAHRLVAHRRSGGASGTGPCSDGSIITVFSSPRDDWRPSPRGSVVGARARVSSAAASPAARSRLEHHAAQAADLRQRFGQLFSRSATACRGSFSRPLSMIAHSMSAGPGPRSSAAAALLSRPSSPARRRLLARYGRCRDSSSYKNRRYRLHVGPPVRPRERRRTARRHVRRSPHGGSCQRQRRSPVAAILLNAEVEQLHEVAIRRRSRLLRLVMNTFAGFNVGGARCPSRARACSAPSA